MYGQTVENIPVGLPPTVTPETPVSEAAEYLRGIRVPALPVLEDGTVVGVVTESDLVALSTEPGGRPTVDGITSGPVATISPSTTLGEAAATMRSTGVEHLPVVTDGVYSGMLSAETLASSLPGHRRHVQRRNDPLGVNSSMNQPMRASD